MKKTTNLENRKIFNLNDEITVMTFNYNQKYNNISGKLILFKDDTIIGLMKKSNYELVLKGKKRLGKVWIQNILDDNYLYNLSDNIVVYQDNENKQWQIKQRYNFNLKQDEFNLKDIDLLNRKIGNWFENNNKQYEHDINKAYTLKMNQK